MIRIIFYAVMALACTGMLIFIWMEDAFGKGVAFMICVLCLLCGLGIGFEVCDLASSDNLYPLSGTVVHTSYETDTVTIEDNSGNLWQFKNADGWEVGDIAACIMDNNGTDLNTDDEIVLAKWCGHEGG